MTVLEAIKNKALEIAQLTEEIKILENKGGLSKFFRHKGLIKKLNLAESFQYDLIDDYLSENNTEYKQLISANYDLLETPNIHFTVYSESHSLFGNRTKEIRGDIQSNGYSYCYSTKTNINAGYFDSMSFPSEFEGSVDHWGSVHLKSTELEYGMFKSFPVKYQGYTDKDGFIKIKVIETRVEWDKKTTIGKLIANHFEYDENKNIAFQENLDRFRMMIAEFKENIQI